MIKKPFNELFNNNFELLSKLGINLNLRPQNLDFETYYQLTKEYENLIIDLATDSRKLKQIKIKLSKNKYTEPLFDTKLYTRNIESSYSKIYENHLNNLPADNIEI